MGFARDNGLDSASFEEGSGTHRCHNPCRQQAR
jgi:hypothetical protein